MSPVPAAALLVGLLASMTPGASGQVVVKAGRNQDLHYPQRMTRFEGRVTNVTPLDFWVADGDNATEDMLLKYDSNAGITAVGPLKTPGGKTYGWPSDFEKVGAINYGIETFDRRLYTFDANTGVCTPVGAQVSYTNLFGLAYDSDHDKLYAVDQKTRKLLLFDRSTGAASVVRTLPSAHTDIRSLAWRKADGLLYYTDDKTEALYTVDPNTGANNLVVALNDGPNAKIDELDFFYGRLYGSYRVFTPSTGLWDMYLVEIDLADLVVEFVGPVVPDCSAHSLRVNSVPEKISWVQTGGPTTAFIARPHDPTSPVSFDSPGLYEFELRADGVGGARTADWVRIRVSDLAKGGPSGPETAR